jgi:hypothetical protein
MGFAQHTAGPAVSGASLMMALQWSVGFKVQHNPKVGFGAEGLWIWKNL